MWHAINMGVSERGKHVLPDLRYYSVNKSDLLISQEEDKFITMTTTIVPQALSGSALLAVLSAQTRTTAMTTSVEEQTDRITGQADQLYEANQWREALTYLEQYSESTNVEVLWRLARLCYKVSGCVVGQYSSCERQMVLGV